VGCCSLQNTAAPITQNATDLTSGVRFLLLDTGLAFDAAYRINNKFDESDPLNKDRKGFFGGISYTKPAAAGVALNRGPLVTLESNVTAIDAAGVVNLTATGYDADGDVLGYTWSATGGVVTGAGARATYRPGGVAPGRYTVRVLAADGHGGTASSEVEITVR
jgi:hypothetical protein